MFNSITWAQYFSTIALLLVCFYVFIGFRYYKWEILSVIGIKKIEETRLSTTAFPNLDNLITSESHEKYLPQHSLEIDISPLVQSFTDEVQAYLEEACKNKIQKKTIMDSLQLIISKYPALKDADCKDDFIQTIINAADLHYPNLIHSNDINRIWN